MTAQLPHPGSVWFNRSLRRPMRVAPFGNSASDITAHDCELTAESPQGVFMASWRGTADEFAATFEPYPQDRYPKTATSP